MGYARQTRKTVTVRRKANGSAKARKVRRKRR